MLAGDGTLNEAAAGLVAPSTALAPLPGGSTNVYSQTLGLSPPTRSTPPRAARRARTAVVPAGRRRAGQRPPFLFCAGIGFDAAVIRGSSATRWVKRVASHPLHIAAAFDTFFSTDDHRTARFDVDARPGELIEDVALAIVSKATPVHVPRHRPLNIARNASSTRRSASPR